jgi:hypothetical protein
LISPSLNLPSGGSALAAPSKPNTEPFGSFLLFLSETGVYWPDSMLHLPIFDYFLPLDLPDKRLKLARLTHSHKYGDKTDTSPITCKVHAKNRTNATQFAAELANCVWKIGGID